MVLDKFNVFVNPSADRKFSDHLEFLSRVSEIGAARLYEDYEITLNFLESTPKACPIYIPFNHIDVELRYKLFGNRYRAVFEIEGSSVYIYDIQDCRQDDNKNLI